MPFMAVLTVALACAIAAKAQVGTSPMQILHPILKDPNKRLAPTSVNRNPGLVDDPSQPAAVPAARPHIAAAQPAKPAVISAKIDDGLAASKLALIGTISGVRGTIYVTNTGPKEITPIIEVAVCDAKGFKVGTASKTGTALAPNADERITLLGTNLNAADLKLMRLTVVVANPNPTLASRPGQ
jgi:hypothetical protein